MRLVAVGAALTAPAGAAGPVGVPPGGLAGRPGGGGATRQLVGVGAGVSDATHALLHLALLSSFWA